MANIIWFNYSKAKVNWAAILDSTPHQGPLEPGQTKIMPRAGVDLAGWAPSNFTGFTVVSLPKSADDDVIVYATDPVLEAEKLLNELKAAGE